MLQFDVDASGDLAPKTDPGVETGSGTKPIGIAIVPDGSAAYVSTQAWNGSRKLFAFAIGADGALSPGAPPSLPLTASKLWYLSASPDGRSLFLAGGDGHLFDIGAGRVPGAEDAAGGGPRTTPSAWW